MSKFPIANKTISLPRQEIKLGLIVDELDLCVDDQVNFINQILTIYESEERTFIIEQLLYENDLVRADWAEEDEDWFQDAEEFFYLKELNDENI